MNFSLDKLLLSQANIGQSKSSVLNPLQWMTLILVGALASVIYEHAPAWLTILMGGLMALIVGLFVAGFIYFMIRNPDMLRSEQYALLKGAMDKGYFTEKTAALLAGEERKIARGQAIIVDDAGDIGGRIQRRGTGSRGGKN